MPTSKQQEILNSQLNKRLLAYAATAGAAGVSVLAITQSADAKVVYTRAHRFVGINHGALDLNNDGIPDFEFVQSGLGNNWSYLVRPIEFNKLMNHAAPLAAGVVVGPGESFVGGQQSMVFFCICSGEDGSSGQWANKQNQYMGFEFSIKGVSHFGWARLSTSIPNSGQFGNVTLTGYAYETVPLKPIVTGDTTGSDDEESVGQPASAISSSLGALARGAAERKAQESTK